MPADIPGNPRPSGTRVPLSVLATIDPVLRDTGPTTGRPGTRGESRGVRVERPPSEEDPVG